MVGRDWRLEQAMLLPLPCPFDVAIELGLQGVYRAKRNLITDPSQEAKRHLLAIHVLIEVEQVCFDGEFLFAEGGFDADGDRGGGSRMAFDIGVTCVDAVGG